MHFVLTIKYCCLVLVLRAAYLTAPCYSPLCYPQTHDHQRITSSYFQNTSHRPPTVFPVRRARTNPVKDLKSSFDTCTQHGPRLIYPVTRSTHLHYARLTIFTTPTITTRFYLLLLLPVRHSPGKSQSVVARCLSDVCGDCGVGWW
jgi:hypothetical protein